MSRRASQRAALWLGLGMACWAGVASAQTQSAEAIHGQRLAARHCGGCHAIGAGQSPLADAPPFARLHRRYWQGGLDAILSQGMLAPRQAPEEGAPRSHPRMPMARLEDDEVADLRAYLQSLDPRRGKRGECYVTTGRRGDCQKSPVR